MGNRSTGSEIGAAGELWTLYFVQSVFWSGKMWEGKGDDGDDDVDDDHDHDHDHDHDDDMTWHDVIYNWYYDIYYML